MDVDSMDWEDPELLATIQHQSQTVVEEDEEVEELEEAPKDVRSMKLSPATDTKPAPATTANAVAKTGNMVSFYVKKPYSFH